jgi:peptidoglycan pentaglycine glycine transferase (the first glycine)
MPTGAGSIDARHEAELIRMMEKQWNEILAGLPDPHLLQTWEWGQVKAAYGWKPIFHTWPENLNGRCNAAAMILQRSIPNRGFAARLRVLYVPKGPVFDWSNLDIRGQTLDALAQLAHRAGAIFIKIDPDVRTGAGFPGSPEVVEDPLGQGVIEDLKTRGWIVSNEQIQFRNTVLIDLSISEEQMLLRMKQKTRYNVRLAERKGVRVRAGCQNDLPLLYRMYVETSLRDGFVIREEAYYRTLWSTFMQAGLAQALIAEVEGRPVGAVIVFHFLDRAWYMYGMSTQEHREKMPNYLLQWEAMRRLKAAGCQVYDLWGAPDHFNEQDRMWGVYRFKEGLGGQVVRTIGAWDLPVKPLLYRLYTQTLPRLLDMMRRRGVARTRRTAGV